MKVLHITTYVTGGAGIAVKRLHEALLNEGVDSKILCLFALPENMSREIYELNQPRSLTYRVLRKLKLDKNSRLIKNLSGDFEAFSSPYSTYKVHLHPLVTDADVIHLHWISDFVDIPTFFMSVKKPIIWTAHDLNPILGGFHYEQDAIKNPSFSFIEEQLTKIKHDYISKANIHFIGSSTLTVQKIKENLPGIGCSKIPCILDLQNFRPIDKKTAKTALGIDENALIFGTGADDLTNYRKGYWLLLEAIEMMDEKEKNGFKILSFGAKKSTIQTDIQELPHTIRFEPIHDKRLHSLIYSAMDYFVIPSVEETFGLTGTEALLCGTPVITSRTGGMIDYVEDGINGFLFEPMDSIALLAKMRNVMQSSNTLNQLNSRQSIVDWYEREHPVAKHIQLYEEKLRN